MEEAITHVDTGSESKADQATITQFVETRDKLVDLRNELAAEGAADEDDDFGRRKRLAGLRTLITEHEEALRKLDKPYQVATARERSKGVAARIVTLNEDLATAQLKANEAQAQSNRAQAEVKRIREELSEAEASQTHVVRDLHRATAGA